MVTLANAWAAQGVRITLITLAPRSDDTYALDPAVDRVDLHKTQRSHNPFAALANNWGRIHALRGALKACRPDAVISFVARTNILTLIATTSLRVPVIVSERTFLGARAPGGAWNVLHGFLYRRAAAVTTVTRRGAAYMEAKLGCKVEVIPNPVLFPSDIEARAHPPASAKRLDVNSHTLLAIGRLAPEKGFDLLIDAFAQVAGQHPDWSLKIMGEGSCRAELMQAVASKGLSNRVSMPGFTSNVRAEMQQADLFVLSSRFEGFPNVLLEAMSEGLPCVSFDCETGPGELIQHKENGWLVPANDVAALAKALDALMRSADLRKLLGGRAREVISCYSLPAILDQWNSLVKSVAFPYMRCDDERHLRDPVRTAAERRG